MSCASDPPSLPIDGSSSSGGTSDADGSGTTGPSDTETTDNDDASSTGEATNGDGTGSSDDTTGVDRNPPEVESFVPQQNANIIDGRVPLVVVFDVTVPERPATPSLRDTWKIMFSTGDKRYEESIPVVLILSREQ